MKPWIRIFAESLGLIIILQILAYYVFISVIGEYPIGFIIVPLFFLLTAVSLSFFVKKHTDKEPEPRDLLVIKGIKLFAVIIVLVVTLVVNKSYALYSTINFVVFYLVFHIFETIVLLKVNKKKERG